MSIITTNNFRYGYHVVPDRENHIRKTPTKSDTYFHYQIRTLRNQFVKNGVTHIQIYSLQIQAESKRIYVNESTTMQFMMDKLVDCDHRLSENPQHTILNISRLDLPIMSFLYVQLKHCNCTVQLKLLDLDEIFLVQSFPSNVSVVIETQRIAKSTIAAIQQCQNLIKNYVSTWYLNKLVAPAKQISFFDQYQASSLIIKGVVSFQRRVEQRISLKERMLQSVRGSDQDILCVSINKLGKSKIVSQILDQQQPHPIKHIQQKESFQNDQIDTDLQISIIDVRKSVQLRQRQSVGQSQKDVIIPVVTLDSQKQSSAALNCQSKSQEQQAVDTQQYNQIPDQPRDATQIQNHKGESADLNTTDLQLQSSREQIAQIMQILSEKNIRLSQMVSQTSYQQNKTQNIEIDHSTASKIIEETNLVSSTTQKSHANVFSRIQFDGTKVESMDRIDEMQKQPEKVKPFEFLKQYAQPSQQRTQVLNKILNEFQTESMIIADGQQRYFRLFLTNTAFYLTENFIDPEQEQFENLVFSDTVIPIDCIHDIILSEDKQIAHLLVSPQTINQYRQIRLMQLIKQGKETEAIDAEKVPENSVAIEISLIDLPEGSFIQNMDYLLLLEQIIRVLQKRKVRRPDILMKYEEITK